MPTTGAQLTPNPQHGPSSNPGRFAGLGNNVNFPGAIAVAALTPSSQQALIDLLKGIEGRKGLLILTGEVGTGKTTVLNQLRAALAQKSVQTAFLFNPLLDARNFFDFILAEFGIRRDANRGDSFTQLSDWLLARCREGAIVTLIVDEAQGLPTPTLQALGFLLNLEASGQKLLQVVLAGQPELNEKLRSPDLRQIRQQIALRARTSALTLEEAHSYMGQRLGAGDARGDTVFSSEAVETAHFYAGGIPRVMNLLCEHALARARSQQIRPVSAYMIEEAAREFQFDDARPLSPRRGEYVPQGNGASDVPSIYLSRTEMPQEKVVKHDDAPLGAGSSPAQSAEPQQIPSTLPMPASDANSAPRKSNSSVDAPTLLARLNASAAAAGRELSRFTMEPIAEFVSAAIAEAQRIWSKQAARSRLGSTNVYSPVRLSGACKRAWISTLRWLKQPM